MFNEWVGMGDSNKAEFHNYDFHMFLYFTYIDYVDNFDVHCG